MLVSLTAVFLVAPTTACLIDQDCVKKMTMFDTAHGVGWICQRGGCYKCSALNKDPSCHAWIRDERDVKWKTRNTKSVKSYGNMGQFKKITESHYPYSDDTLGQQVSREAEGDLFYDYTDHQWKDKKGDPDE